MIPVGCGRGEERRGEGTMAAMVCVQEPKMARSELLQRDAGDLSHAERKTIFRQARRMRIRARNMQEKKL